MEDNADEYLSISLLVVLEDAHLQSSSFPCIDVVPITGGRRWPALVTIAVNIRVRLCLW